MSENKKYYSFMGITKAVSKNGQFDHIYLDGTLTNITERNVDGKLVMSGRMAINSRSKRINDALGTKFGDDETVWASVNFWERTGENLRAYLKGRTKVRVIVAGPVKVNSYTDRNGSERTELNISVFDWESLEFVNKSAGNTDSGDSRTSNEPPASVAASGGFSELSDDFDDSDLPF